MFAALLERMSAVDVDLESLPGVSVLDKLEHLQSVRRRRVPVAVAAAAAAVPRLAVCIVIVDELVHEEIWRRWCEEEVGVGGVGDPDGATAEVFIHAKFPERVRSAWARARLIRGGAVCYRPAWNSVDVVRAMLALAHEARDCDQIVFATESCLPLYDLQTTARRLLAAPQKSWLRATRAPQSRWEAARCFDAVDPRVVPRSAVHKCLPGWISLTRTHAQEIGALAAALGDALLGAWDSVHAPEEIFFPTMLALLGHLRADAEEEEEGDGVRRTAVTFAEWTRRGDAHPATHTLNARTVHKMRMDGALFGRKFPEHTSIETWAAGVRMN